MEGKNNKFFIKIEEPKAFHNTTEKLNEFLKDIKFLEKIAKGNGKTQKSLEDTLDLLKEDLKNAKLQRDAILKGDAYGNKVESVGLSSPKGGEKPKREYEMFEYTHEVRMPERKGDAIIEKVADALTGGGSGIFKSILEAMSPQPTEALKEEVDKTKNEIIEFKDYVKEEIAARKDALYDYKLEKGIKEPYSDEEKVQNKSDALYTAGDDKYFIDVGIAENGKDWAYLEEAQELYKSYFENLKIAYEDDIESIQLIQKEEEEYYQKLEEYLDKNDKQKETLAVAESKRRKEEEEAGIKSLEMKQVEDELREETINKEIEGIKTISAVKIDYSKLEDTLAQHRAREAEKEKKAKEASIALEKKQLEVKTDTLKKLGESFKEFGKSWGTKWLAGTLSGVGNAFGKLSEIIKTKGEENIKNLETQSQSVAENADKQKSSFEGLMGKISEVSGYVSMATDAIVMATNEQLDRKIAEADEKIKEISAKYKEATDARKASDAELKKLQEQAKNAQGEELAAIQTRIEAEKDKNIKLKNEESQYQKEKEKEEKRKEKLEKQKTRNELGRQIIKALADTASGITKAYSASPLTLGMPWAAIVAAQGAIQVAAISKQMAKLEDGGLLRGQRHSQGGMPILGSNIEVEGGEYVVNRQSTGKNLGLLGYINSQRRELSPADISSFFATSGRVPEPSFSRMFEEGGQLPVMERNVNVDNELMMEAIRNIKFEPKVSVTDINSAQSDVVKVDSWVGM